MNKCVYLVPGFAQPVDPDFAELYAKALQVAYPESAFIATENGFIMTDSPKAVWKDEYRALI